MTRSVTTVLSWSPWTGRWVEDGPAVGEASCQTLALRDELGHSANKAESVREWKATLRSSGVMPPEGDPGGANCARVPTATDARSCSSLATFLDDPPPPPLCLALALSRSTREPLPLALARRTPLSQPAPDGHR